MTTATDYLNAFELFNVRLNGELCVYVQNRTTNSEYPPLARDQDPLSRNHQHWLMATTLKPKVEGQFDSQSLISSLVLNQSPIRGKFRHLSRPISHLQDDPRVLYIIGRDGSMRPPTHHIPP
jgi:hypothetical protein